MTSTFELEAVRVRGPRAIGPWTSDLLVRLIIGNVAAGLLIGAGCWQVSGGYDEPTQVAWMVSVLAGLGAAGITNGLWLLRGIQTVSAARDVVVPSIRVVRTKEHRAQAGDMGTVAVQGGSRIHLASCALAIGKRTIAVDRDDPGLRPCAACLPREAAAR